MDCIKVARYTGTIKGRSSMNFDTALEKGLVHFAGIEKTKTGSGEKQNAYIIRQNCFLKSFFYLVVLATICAVYIFSTTWRIEFIQREVIDEEVKHRKTEHGVQVKLVSLMLQQKKSMEEELDFVNRIEEFRSTMLKEHGSYSAFLEKHSTAVPADAASTIKDRFSKTSERLEHLIEDIITPVQAKAENSKQLLAALQQNIIQEIKEDEEELDFFLKKLGRYGVSRGAAQSLEKRKYVTGGTNGNPDEISHISEIEEDTKNTEKDVENSLEEFFAQLRDISFPKLRRVALQKMERFASDVLKDLKDKEKELDSDSVARSVNSLLMRYAPTADRYKENSEESIIEFMKRTLKEAKLAFAKDQLLDLYQDWRVRNKITTIQLLSKVESVLALEDTDDVLDLKF